VPIRRRRLIGALVAAAVLVLGGGIAVLIVAASSSDGSAPHPASSTAPPTRADVARFSAEPGDDGRLRITGTVPGGITSATIGTRTVPVRDGTFTLTAAERPDVVTLRGPAAAHMRGRPDIAVATPVGDPPAVVVSFDPDPDTDAPLGRPTTLRAAAAAVPFALLAPDPPPRGAPMVRWAGPAPGVPARAELRYLRTSGPGITVTERAAARGARHRRPVVTRHAPDAAVVRTVLAGTVADITGRRRDLDDLLAVAASLTPVAP
jgi:hypothetical protein